MDGWMGGWVDGWIDEWKDVACVVIYVGLLASRKSLL